MSFNFSKSALLFLIASTLYSADQCLAVPADLDDDGIPNLVETGLGLDPNNSADGTLDLDTDGWDNETEYRFGTDLNNNAENPATLTGPSHYKVFASDAVAGDHLGSSLAIHGDTALIGAFFDDDNGRSSGAVYVFNRVGSRWVEPK